MSKKFDKVYIHVAGRMPLDMILRNWSEEELQELQDFDEDAWEELHGIVTDQIGYWIQDGTFIVDVDPVE